jgi:ketosteroid isomerase-like protein
VAEQQHGFAGGTVLPDQPVAGALSDAPPLAALSPVAPRPDLEQQPDHRTKPSYSAVSLLRDRLLTDARVAARRLGPQLMRGRSSATHSRTGVSPVHTRLAPTLVLLVLGCSGGLPGTSRLDLQRARIQIDSLNSKFVTWLAAEQLDSAAGLYAKDGVLMGLNAPPVEGRTNIRAAWAGMTSAHRLQLVLQATDLLGGDSVLIERGRYALHVAPKAVPDSSAPASDDHGSYLVVWIHREGRWQVKFDIAASDKPAAAAVAPGS